MSEERRVAPAEERSVFLAEERRVAPAEERRVAPAEERRVAPAEERRVAPAEERRVSLPEERRVAPAEERRVAPAEERRVAPADERRVSLAEERRLSLAEERRVAPDEKKYAILTKDSVKVMAEAAGHADVPETVTGLLGEDVSYRLREITQKSAQFMRHSKRRRMNVDDFNKACKHSDIMPIHGHRSSEAPSPFRQTREGEIHFIEDPETNFASMAFNSYIPKTLGETTLKAHWLAVEGIQKTFTPSGQSSSSSSSKSEVSTGLLKYFDKITQAILGHDEEMIKTALMDLKANPNISPLLPHFVSFVSNGVKTVSHDSSQLMKILHTVNSLVYNKSLFMEVQPFLSLLLQSVQYCLLEPLAASINPSNDHWSLRDYAARLLSYVVSIWSNSVNQLERFTEKTLREVLYDHSKAFCCHYGAVMGLLNLGSQNIERVLLPHLSTYWPYLTTAMRSQDTETVLAKIDSHYVYSAILLCVESILKKHINDFKQKYMQDKETDPEEGSSSVVEPNLDHSLDKLARSRNSNVSGFISMFDKSPCAFYNEMHEYFGDSLSMQMPDMPELKCIVFKPTPKEVDVTLADPETSKSGEELLDEFMEQVKIEVEIEKKRKEQEQFEREKWEREEQARLEKIQLEYERRMADHRQQLQLAYQSKARGEVIGSFDEIDIEGDNGAKSDNSDKSEEEATGSEPGAVALAVKSTVSGPGQGIKLTITKRPRLTLNLKQSTPSPHSSHQQKDSKETKSSRKRKQSFSEMFDFEDISDYEAAPSYTSKAFYSSEGEGSSDGGSGRKSLTMKFRKHEPPSD